MIPLFTTTPSNIRNPVSVLAFNNELPDKIKAISEPVAAKGIENINTKGVMRDSNTEARIIYINKIATAIRKYSVDLMY